MQVVKHCQGIYGVRRFGGRIPLRNRKMVCYQAFMLNTGVQLFMMGFEKTEKSREEEGDRLPCYNPRSPIEHGRNVTERSQITLSVERCPFIDHVQLK